MATITFKVNKKGEVAIEVDGVMGASCSDITAKFEEALGTKTDTQMKPEWFVELEGTKNYVSEE